MNSLHKVFFGICIFTSVLSLAAIKSPPEGKNNDHSPATGIFCPSKEDVLVVPSRPGGRTLTGGLVPKSNVYPLKRDSLKKAINREANRASLMSAILPGLGQVYNRKYWKVPIIYAALGGIGYFARNFNGEYQDYHNELLFRYKNVTTGQINSFPEYTTANLVTLKNQAKKYRDLCFIGMGICYVLNIIDANVDAHLKTFDVNDNLSLSVTPKTFYCSKSPNGLAGGISLALHFK